jgi:hypothetical protein
MRTEGAEVRRASSALYSRSNCPPAPQQMMVTSVFVRPGGLRGPAATGEEGIFDGKTCFGRCNICNCDVRCLRCVALAGITAISQLDATMIHFVRKPSGTCLVSRKRIW